MTEFHPPSDSLEAISNFIQACNPELVAAIAEAHHNSPSPSIFAPLEEQLEWMLPGICDE